MAKSSVMTSLNGRAVKDEKSIYGVKLEGRTLTVTPAVGDPVTFTTEDHIYDVATTSSSGLLSAADKTKLDSLPTDKKAFTWGTLARKS